MGYGGSVWHVSVSPSPWVSVNRHTLFKQCLKALRGVGSASKGEWKEVGGTTPDGRRIVHVRRRLSAREDARIGPAIDIRNTDEAWDRYTAMALLLPEAVDEMAREEIRGG